MTTNPERRFELIGVLILLATYSSLYLPLHALMDDYAALSDVYTNTFEIVKITASHGRFINGIFITNWFKIFNSVDKLWCIRLIGIIGSCVIFILMMRLLINHKFQYVESFFISLGTCLLPPFIEMANWAITVPNSWSGAIALLGALKLDNVINKSKNNTLTFHELYLIIRSRYFLMAIMYLVLAMFSYTPTAQMIFLVPLLWLLGDDDAVVLKNKLYYVFLALICFFIASLVFLVIYKTYFNIFFPGMNLGNRSLVTSPFALLLKIKWFFVEVIPIVSNLFFLAPNSVISGVVLLICIGQFIVMPGSWQKRFIMFIVWVVIIMASYSISLVTKENWPSYRSQFALQIIFWVSFWLGLRRIGRLVMRIVPINISLRIFKPVIFFSIIFRTLSEAIFFPWAGNF